MGRIKTEISEGELLDKISILEIKLSKIEDENLLKEVKKEYEILSKLKKENIKSSQKIESLYKDLKMTNEQIWVIENEKRLFEKNSDFREKFIQVCRDEYITNDKRAKIKREINNILDSYIKEVKQHTKY